MKLERFMVQLTRAQLDFLVSESERRGASISQVVRDLVLAEMYRFEEREALLKRL